jgi:prepilin signal peptidase PulO-like enzyme (type II secretory pathway)
VDMWGALYVGGLGFAVGWNVWRLAFCFGPSAPCHPPLLCRTAVSLLCGILFTIAWIQVGRDITQQILTLLLLVFCLLVSLTDALFLRIPNVVLMTALPVLLGLRWLEQPDAWLSSLLAGSFGLLLFGIISVLRPDAVGMGDAKLAGVLAAAVGWRMFAGGLTVGCVLALAAGVLMLLGGRAGRGAVLPFAPFLSAGVLVVRLFG